MEKTRLGISAAFASVILFAVAFFGGYIPAVIIAGYILLCEESAWLKRMSVKCIVIMLCFSVISMSLSLLPDLLEDLLSGTYEGLTYKIYSIVLKTDSIIGELVYYAKTAVFVLMVIFSFRQKDLRIPLLDGLIDRHFN